MGLTGRLTLFDEFLRVWLLDLLFSMNSLEISHDGVDW